MKPGQIIVATTGEYSDFGISDIFVVKKRFSFDKKLREAVDSGGYVDTYGFLGSLRNAGLVETVDDATVRVVHFAEYGCPRYHANDADDDVAEASVEQDVVASALPVEREDERIVDALVAKRTASLGTRSCGCKKGVRR